MSALSPFLSDTAMVLAAGFGKRMQPLTQDKPKPLLQVGGRSMLDLALDHLVEAGVTRSVVNTHYLGEQIAAHVHSRKDIEIILSPEDRILDTGGGVKKALPHFGGKPFFVLGGDMPFTDGAAPTLQRMAHAWDPARMDQLLLLYPTAKAKGFGPSGDFMRREDGTLWRKESLPPRDYVFISAQIVKPELYNERGDEVFSNNRIFDLCEQRGRLFGIVHEGGCFHVGTPQDLAEANRLLATKEGWG